MFSSFFTSRCASCLIPLTRADDAEKQICTSCASQLKRCTTNYCLRCGSIFKYSQKSEQRKPVRYCSHCQGNHLPWHDLRFLSLYDGLLEDIIKAAKFNEDILLARILGCFLQDIVAELPPCDMIIPMPLHNKRLIDRGYNQCYEIAKPIAHTLNIPIQHKALLKIKNTKAQVNLSREERLTNLIDTFQANSKSVANKKIILLDDVVTTGSTLLHASQALQEAGAKEIYVLYVARTAI